MKGIAELLGRVVAAPDSVSIPFMIAGSFASTAHGMPRTTPDLAGADANACEDDERQSVGAEPAA